ncbi:MAG TPA: TonB-dependent receptor, partial [Bryobacteraceae bacterium]|nr:TonB-dependent receptor [Bryobacteraceae bacterium]
MRQLLLALTLTGAIAFGQSTASLSGTVLDALGQPIAGAGVSLSNALTGFSQRLETSAEGTFRFGNLPLRTYVLRVKRDGFQASEQVIELLSNLPKTLEVKLQLGPVSEAISVEATDRLQLVEPEGTGTRTELNAKAIAEMPLSPTSRGLESVLLSFSGFAANANGAIHPRGAHNQMTFVVDGMPVSDQLTGAFANAIDTNIVQSVELMTGNIPAEYGSKVSGVAVVTTKSGMGSGRRATGSVQLNAAQFDTLSQVTQVGGGSDRWGYFASVNALKTHRYLDQVSLDNLHNGGNSERGFFRLDFLPSISDQLRFNLMLGRSSFELANLRSQQAAGQNQRQLLRDASLSVGWLRTLSPRSTIDAMFSWRTSNAELLPSTGDTPVTAFQDRRLSNYTSALRWTGQHGAHQIRTGFDWQHFPVREHFRFGITNPAFNAPDSPDFLPTLLPFDLSRGGRLFRFAGRNSGNLYSGFAQDTVRAGRWTFTLGLRYDAYRFLAAGNQLQPRVGVAFHLRETGTVFRASYNRTYQTPPNENLLLSSSAESAVLVPESVREALGGAFVIIRPERQNVYEAGLQQALGRWASLNLAVYHKDSRDLQDNDNFFNTGIIFPTSLA